ncbi:MAG: hypothetical protein GXP62_17055 [Oligoflexia bacterium]|nr:hypothetical protein [Oligoflexia bacterium]
MTRLWLTALLLISTGCGNADPCAGTRDLSQSPAGLALTQQEHGVGWGQQECFQCHQIWKIHQQDCTSGVSIDVASINDQIDVEDASTCATCHGDNGVPGLLPADTGGTL